jgi:hypothetical protein
VHQETHHHQVSPVCIKSPCDTKVLVHSDNLGRFQTFHTIRTCSQQPSARTRDAALYARAIPQCVIISCTLPVGGILGLRVGHSASCPQLEAAFSHVAYDEAVAVGTLVVAPIAAPITGHFEA